MRYRRANGRDWARRRVDARSTRPPRGEGAPRHADPLGRPREPSQSGHRRLHADLQLHARSRGFARNSGSRSGSRSGRREFARGMERLQRPRVDSPARASASSIQSRPSLQSARTIQNSRSALPSRREAWVSPCERLQSKAARKLSSSAWSRSSHAFWSGPEVRARPARRKRGSTRDGGPEDLLPRRLAEVVERVLPDRLEHREAGLLLLVPPAGRGSCRSATPGRRARRVAPADASAASSVQPPAKTARRAKSYGASSLEEAVTPVDRRAQSPVPLRRSRGPPVRRSRRSSSRASSRRRSRSTRAAASSIASGRPSSLRQIAATAGALASVSAKSGRTACARSTKSATASLAATASQPAVTSGYARVAAPGRRARPRRGAALGS